MDSVAAALPMGAGRSPLVLASTSIVGLLLVILFYFVQKRKRPRKAIVPPDGIFDLELLGLFNGKTGPIFMGVCGKVVNVSSSENIKVGEGYGRLWAGKDATYALAVLSLKPEDANKLDFTLKQFTDEQRTALAGWYKHFTARYPVVGRLREYDGWDFSDIEKEAEKQRPFGLKEESAEAKPEPSSEEPVMLRAGDKVKLQGLEDENLNGKVGVLRSLVASTGKFAIELDGDDGTVQVKPSNILKV
ncbi:unnamed protein product [Cladocopium goreaui]|uniref:Ankyrin-1 n=1 Tax=Cladocopium goreaui TaxID=2562237 RepID=A0A9P1FJN3_9DINO|nr:unnamed protein product [Cladocopium goreaui]|mmetsp:Transcript_80183/g.163205  ORF Transcript_80183/g.163205 Transcript_80183/m.163205 type:complete len:246 (-) Transcript_80183:77-814(-)